MAQLAWQDAMSALQPRLVEFVELFRQSAAAVDDADQPIAAAYLAREEALLEFVAFEQAGNDGSPPVRGLIDAWSG